VAGVDKIIAVAKSVEESLIRSGVPAEKVVTIYGAIDLKRFRPAAPDPALRKELGIDEQTWVVGKVADYRPWKGYGIFLEAASIILKEEPRVRFLAVGGKSDYFDEMKAIARRLSIEKSVTFTGFRDDVERFYPLMQVSVNCATSGEGLPGVLRESLAMEIPVVATDVGGNREVVLDGQTGCLIPSHDPAALARAILGLLRNPESARRLGQQGRRFVEQNFSIESMVNQTEAVYQSLMASGS
jgi:glycosyltransferase involved in cell wall biosynthesis